MHCLKTPDFPKVLPVLWEITITRSTISLFHGGYDVNFLRNVVGIEPFGPELKARHIVYIYVQYSLAGERNQIYIAVR